MSKRKEAKKAGYDSYTEKELAENQLAGVEYHPNPIEYTVPASVHKYTPDFKHKHYLIEVKAFLRKGDQQKYKLIAESARKQGYELIFLLENPDKKAGKKRKNGTYLTVADQIDNMDLRWFTADTINQILE